MILLNDILNLSDDELRNTKIRFNQENMDYDPITFFKEGSERLYIGQFWNYKTRSFKLGQITIGFIRIDRDKWLLFDVHWNITAEGSIDRVEYWSITHGNTYYSIGNGNASGTVNLFDDYLELEDFGDYPEGETEILIRAIDTDGLIGEEAMPDIKAMYLHKRIPDSYRKKGAANPIKYNY